MGIKKARAIHEETLGRTVTLRELADLLGQQGYPIHNSMISRMEHTVEYLYPFMPELLVSGLGKPQIVNLLNLRADALKIWQQYSVMTETDSDFNEIFGRVCTQFDDPEVYSFEMFRDEFIGMLVNVLPHPSLNYDRWLLELDPKARNQRKLFGEPEPVASHLVDADRQTWQSTASLPGTANDENQQGGSSLKPKLNNAPVLPKQPDPDNDDGDNDDVTSEWFGSCGSPRLPKTEVQDDFLGGPSVLTGDVIPDEYHFIPDAGNIAVSASAFAGAQVGLTADTPSDAVSIASEMPGLSLLPTEPALSSVEFANVGLEPVTDIWAIPALQDDIEHLQDMAYRLAYELAEAMGCEVHVSEDKNASAAGFSVSEHGGEFALFLAGLSGHVPNKQFNMFMFCLNFFGSQSAGDTPVFDDVHVVKSLRLIRVIRRLRELQRNMAAEQNDGRRHEH